MRRAQRIARAAGLAGLLVLALAAPTSAFELNGGCTLELSSTDSSGAALDTASNGQGGTQDDPFIVDWNGTVSWSGSSGDTVFRNHSWQVSVFNIPTPLRGGDPNDGEETAATGSTGVSENAPFAFTGLYFVSGDITGDGGARCDGSAWFKLDGNPVTTIPFWVAIVIILIGLLMVWSSRGTDLGAMAPVHAGPPPPAPPADDAGVPAAPRPGGDASGAPVDTDTASWPTEDRS